MTHQDNQEIAPPRVSPESQHSLGLRVIAIYKGFETLGLLLAAGAAFHLQHHQNVDRLVHWLEHLSLTDTNGLRWQLVEALMKLGPSRFVALGMVALGYAALHATEGIGLWMRKRWAEWFTVIATASLIPIELYETTQHFSWIKLGVLLTNIVIVIYLTRVAREAYRHG